MTARVKGWAISACVVVAAPMLLGGCFGAADRSAASATSVDLQSADTQADVGVPIRTVKRSGPRVASSEAIAPRESALPSPSEIFDFHPPGTKPDSWRQPFVIDPNDGPLAGYVRRMDAELTESTAQTKAAAQAPTRKRVCPSSGPAGTVATSCGENDVAKSLAR